MALRCIHATLGIKRVNQNHIGTLTYMHLNIILPVIYYISAYIVHINRSALTVFCSEEIVLHQLFTLIPYNLFENHRKGY